MVYMWGEQGHQELSHNHDDVNDAFNYHAVDNCHIGAFDYDKLNSEIANSI